MTEEDNDTPGITVSPTYLNIPEGRVALLHGGAEHAADLGGARVRVDLGRPARRRSEFRCCGRSSVWLGTGDWNYPETFTVTAPEEPGTVDGTLWVRHWAESDDPDYHYTPVATVTATAVDNDTGLGLGGAAQPDGHGGRVR